MSYVRVKSINRYIYTYIYIYNVAVYPIGEQSVNIQGDIFTILCVLALAPISVSHVYYIYTHVYTQY